MTKKELKRFFGHKWGEITPLPVVNIVWDKTNYTLFPNKNGGLVDITPRDDWSCEILAHKRGMDVRLVKNYVEDLKYVNSRTW